MTDRSADREGNGARARIRDDLRLLERYHLHGDAGARDEVIERSLPLARRLARRYVRPDEPIDDLVQVASMGLVKAVDRFDPTRGVAFSSFAVPTIIGELKRYFRDVGWAVHVPRSIQERALEVNRAATELSRALGRSPTTSELAAATDFTREEVLEAVEAATAYDSVSLETPGTTGEGDLEMVGEQLGVEEPGYELAEYSATLAPELRALPDRGRVQAEGFPRRVRRRAGFEPGQGFDRHPGSARHGGKRQPVCFPRCLQLSYKLAENEIKRCGVGEFLGGEHLLEAQGHR